MLHRPLATHANPLLQRLTEELILAGLAPDRAREEAEALMRKQHEREAAESLDRLTGEYCCGF